MLVEKTVISELGESQPWKMKFARFTAQSYQQISSALKNVLGKLRKTFMEKLLA